MTTDHVWVRRERHGEDKLDEWADEDAQFDVLAEADSLVAQEIERTIAMHDLEWEHWGGR